MVSTLLFLAFSLSQNTLAQELTIQVGEKIKTQNITDLKKLFKTHQITNQDPVYKKKVTFLAFSLTEILEFMGPIDPSFNEISFTAIDGYSPSMPTKDALKHKAFIAFREKSRTNGFSLDKIAPYYIIWENDSSVPEHYPRPYQLTKITVTSFQEKFKEIYPKALAENENAADGFLLFRKHCIRCHSINGIGGKVGPELNSPNNVLEYWDNAKIKVFIQDPNAFRGNSIMPKIPELTSQDVEKIVSYFSFMKSYKKIK